METKPEDWEIQELRQLALSRLYVCPNCEAIMWDSAGDGRFKTYLPENARVKDKQAQIVAAEQQKKQMERDNPGLIMSLTADSTKHVSVWEKAIDAG